MLEKKRFYKIVAISAPVYDRSDLKAGITSGVPSQALDS